MAQLRVGTSSPLVAGTSTPLMAGTSVLALPVALGEPMMGYGLRKGGAEAFHDTLHARALYLRGDHHLYCIAEDPPD